MTDGSLVHGMFVSVPWASPFGTIPGVHARSSDWALSRWPTYKRLFREAWALRRRREDLLVVTASAELVLLCALTAFRRRQRIVAYDFLAPRSRPVQMLGRLVLRRVDRWVLIRRGDAAMLARRYHVAESRCSFVPFPAGRTGEASRLGDYIYTAGTAHRDWPTLLAALEQVRRRAVICTRPPLQTDNPYVDSRPLPTPVEGRKLGAGARLVVLPMLDTELPSGPVVLVDAMAAGKAVIATEVNGTRDYITHGVTGWLVPPGDADALARQIAAVIDDDVLLTEVGRAASESVLAAEQSFALVVLAATSAT
jgi:glycosyltransferase involved in cell wall biosynthesis